MWEWLVSPIDPLRPHDLDLATAYHGRLMVLAWGILAPLAVLIARFFKILPSQNWPAQLDSNVWWRSHWIGQSVVLVLTIGALSLVWPLNPFRIGLHAWLGYLMVLGLAAQVLLGIFRGSKGGPTAPALDGSWRGDHYDMTPWRLMFETLHKTLGYALLLVSVVTIIAGLWHANGLMWMWLVLPIWWFMLAVCFWILQSRGMAMDTYQAIWGDDPDHPGNRMNAPGWGVRRPGDRDAGGSDVRNDRRDRV